MNDIVSQSHAGRTPWVRYALIAAFLASLTFLIVRGPGYAWTRGKDFVLVYGPARTWLVGGNPYDSADIDRVWMEAGGKYEARPSTRWDGALIYPPTTLLMFAPFAALPWQIAYPAWIIANVGFLAFTLWGIARLAGFAIHHRHTWIFITAAMLFQPVHTTFRVSQTPLFVMALLMVGLICGMAQRSSRVRSVLSGAMFSFATLIKPQIGMPFLAFEVLRRRWLALIVAAAIGVVMIALAVLPMTIRDIPWWSMWQENLAAFTQGSAGDPTRFNPVRHQLLNLHYPLHEVIENRTTVNALVLAFVGGVAMWFFRLWFVECGLWIAGRRDSQSSSESAIQNRQSKIHNPDLLLPLSMIAVLSLMIVYHRFYDAVLLLLPMAWAVRALVRRRSDWIGWGVLILFVPYYLNIATVLSVVEKRGALPSWILDQWWWDMLVMPQQAWALPILAILLLIANERRGSKSFEQVQ